MSARYTPSTTCTRMVLRFSSILLAPFLGMVGGTSILRGLRAGAKQVGESTKGGAVGVFHAANFFGRV